MKKYSNGINGLRGIISIIIALFHFELIFPLSNNGIFKTGYIGVEFFFILSGFLVAKNFYEKNQQNIVSVIKHKIKKMYPAYFIALLLLISVYVFKWYNGNYINWLNENNNYAFFLTEILILQSLGISQFNYVNGPAWYISSLLICIIVIMQLMKKTAKQDKSNIIYLLISCIIYGVFYIVDPSMSPNKIWLGILSTAILRGIAGISLGVYLYRITKKYEEKIKKNSKTTVNLIEIISFIWLLSLLLFREPSRLNYLIFIPSCILISNMFINEGIISKILTLKIFKFLGIISFEFYILQSPCSNIINCWFSNIPQPFITLLYLSLNLFAATMIYFITKNSQKLSMQKKDNLN